MPPSITCPVCGMTSHNLNDVREGYCGHCHDWTSAIKELANFPFELEHPMHFDRTGQPITMARWTWLWEKARRADPGHPAHKYHRVAYDELPDGIVVSTIWDGTDIGAAMDGGPPLIFETMIFIDGGGEHTEKYTTEAEALATHQTLVKSLRLVGRSFLDELEAEAD